MTEMDVEECEVMDQANQQNSDSTYAIEQAHSDDVNGILDIIRPLEKTGILVKRSKSRIEEDIEAFLIAKWKQQIIGCCAIFAHADKAELACIAVHERFRGSSKFPNIGSRLLSTSENIARNRGITTIFVLTTQAREWFLDKGFVDASIEDLPAQKQELYNWQRQSKILAKTLP